MHECWGTHRMNILLSFYDFCTVYGLHTRVNCVASGSLMSGVVGMGHHSKADAELLNHFTSSVECDVMDRVGEVGGGGTLQTYQLFYSDLFCFVFFFQETLFCVFILMA